MANLRWFRKHQKVMLVVFGVILMAVFVLGSVLPFWAPSGPNASQEQLEQYNKPVVQWSGGNLTRGQLQNLLDLHFATINFQRALVEDSLRHSPQGPLVRLISPIANNSLESADRAIFGRYMLAQFARERFGMVLSDDAVYDYLQAVCNSDIDQAYLTKIARRVNQNVGYNQLHEYIKMELTSMRLEDIIGESFYLSTAGAAPVSVLDAWQAFLQNETQIECAVEEFKVEDFLTQVTAQPSAAELRSIFDEGKMRDADPTHELPGFKRPRKVRVEYVSADPIAFLDLAIQDVTPEQVLAEYNRLSEAKDPLVMEPITTPEKEPTEQPDGEKLEDDAPPAADAGEGNPPTDAPAPAAAGEESGAETMPADPAPAPENPADPDKDGGNAPPAEQKSGEGQEAPENKDGGGGVELSSLDPKFVAAYAVRQETQETDAPPQEPVDKPADAPQDATPQENPPADSAEKPPQEEPAKDEPAADPAMQPPAQEAPQESDQRVRKLDAELEKVIKQRMKREEATQNMQKALDKVRSAMQEFSLDVQQHEASKSLPEADQFPMPANIDLATIATENHLKHGVTELVTYEQLAEDPVGMATEFFSDPNTGQFSTRRAVDDIFVNFDRTSLYAVDGINGLGGSFVYWLTEKVDSRIPSFEEAQADVLAFWKHKRALELAQSAAEKARDELQAGGKMLAMERPDKAKMTGAFRWFQSSFNQVNYGRPQGVTNAGEEFMRAAFGLATNEYAVGVNADRSAVYLIQLVAGEPRTAEQLRDLYLDQVASTRRVSPSATNAFYSRNSINKLIDHINDDLHVEWLAY